MRDAEAFAAFYEARYASVAAAVRVTLGDTQLARDAVDEAFVRAAERWSEVRHADRPAAWVYRVAVNWAHSWRRKRSRRPTRSVQALDRAHLDDLPDLDLAAQLADLPLQQRQLLVLRVAFGLSVRETAELLGVAEGSVKSGVHRAKQRLRTAAADDGPTEPVEQEAHDGRP